MTKRSDLGFRRTESVWVFPLYHDVLVTIWSSCESERLLDQTNADKHEEKLHTSQSWWLLNESIKSFWRMSPSMDTGEKKKKIQCHLSDNLQENINQQTEERTRSFRIIQKNWHKVLLQIKIDPRSWPFDRERQDRIMKKIHDTIGTVSKEQKSKNR